MSIQPDFSWLMNDECSSSKTNLRPRHFYSLDTPVYDARAAVPDTDEVFEYQPCLLFDFSEPELLPSLSPPELLPSPVKSELLPSPVEPQLLPSPVEPQLLPSPVEPQLLPSSVSPLELLPSPVEPQLFPSPVEPQLLPSPVEPQLLPSSVSPVEPQLLPVESELLPSSHLPVEPAVLTSDLRAGPTAQSSEEPAEKKPRLSDFAKPFVSKSDRKPRSDKHSKTSEKTFLKKFSKLAVQNTVPAKKSWNGFKIPKTIFRVQDTLYLHPDPEDYEYIFGPE